MTQAELDREVSRTTGESMGIIRQHGFSILPLSEGPREEEVQEAGPQLVDWDELDGLRRRAA